MYDAQQRMLNNDDNPIYDLLLTSSKYRTTDSLVSSLTKEKVLNEAKERFWTKQISEAKAKANDDAITIENEKKTFLVYNQQQEKEDPFSINHTNLNIDLLMHIIEGRQRIIIQCIQCNHDFNKTFFHDDRDDNEDGSSSSSSMY